MDKTLKNFDGQVLFQRMSGTIVLVTETDLGHSGQEMENFRFAYFFRKW